MYEILNLVSRFGHLRSRDVAHVFNWDEQKARRQLNSLTRDKLLLTADRPNKTKVFGLSGQGCNALLEQNPDAICENAQKYLNRLGITYLHRCRANEVALYFLNTYPVSTEYEIQTGRAPLTSVLGKVPDFLIYTDGGVIHGEVERTRRNAKGMADLIKWFIQVFNLKYPYKPVIDEDKDLYLLRVDFYCTKTFQTTFYNQLSAQLGELRAKDLIDCYVNFSPIDFADSAEKR